MDEPKGLKRFVDWLKGIDHYDYGVCQYCGEDPYDYVDVGVGGRGVPVAITCCHRAVVDYNQSVTGLAYAFAFWRLFVPFQWIIDKFFWCKYQLFWLFIPINPRYERVDIKDAYDYPFLICNGDRIYRPKRKEE